MKNKEKMNSIDAGIKKIAPKKWSKASPTIAALVWNRVYKNSKTNN